VTPGNREWFWPDITRYPYSLEKSRALLEGLGLRNRDADEWLEDNKGNEARFTLKVFGGASVIERTAEVLREDLRQVGIAMDVVPLEPNTVIAQVVAGDFDAALVAFQLTDLDPAISLDFWLSSGSTHFWNAEQKTPATDWEREIDTIMHKQATTTDMQERKRLFNDAQRIFAENLPILYFAAPRSYLAVTPRVVTMTPTVARPQVLWNPEVVSVTAGSGGPGS
jgi:peptide/nickel transport system substrate-binding protein